MLLPKPQPRTNKATSAGLPSRTVATISSSLPERTEERIQTYVEQARTTLPKAALTALRSPRGRTIRLALTSFDTSAEAYAYLNELVKEHPAHRSAWVFHNN